MNAAGKVISSQEWRKLGEVEQKKCIPDYIPRGLEGCAGLELIEMPRLVINGKRVNGTASRIRSWGESLNASNFKRQRIC